MKKVLATPNRIVVFLHPNMGDAVWHTVTLRWIRESFPDAFISVITGKLAIDILKSCGFANEVLLRSSPLKMWFWLIRKRFDLAYLVYPQNRLVRIAKLARISTIVGVRGGKVDHFLDYSVEERFDEHAILGLNRRLLGEIGGISSLDETRIELPTLDTYSIAGQFLEQIQGEFVAIMPGASHPNKVWPKERFEDICLRLRHKGVSTVTLGGPGESWKGVADFDLSGKLGVLESGVILRASKALVTNDTGLMHLGGAVGTKIVGIFGALTPVTHYPPGSKNRLIFKSCSCERRSVNNCSRSCIDAISTDEVWRELSEVLDES